MEIATNRADVVQELITRVKQANPNASVVPGTPLYDLLVYHLADVITEERQLVNVLTNIARVSPMFGDDGKLLPEFADMDQYLTDRFFLSRPESSEIYDTLYLRFLSKTGIRILAGSSVWYGDLQITVAPTFIPEDSPFWKFEVYDGGFVYSHPVDIALRLDVETTIPATEDWVTGGVQFESSTPTLILGAVSRKAVNTVAAPEVTFEYLRNSISNRSLSNPRGILYNLRTNLGFNPDKLLRAKVMHTMDASFIERRKILFNDTMTDPDSSLHGFGRTDTSGFRLLTAVVSGDGKILLDYGAGLYISPVEAVHIDRSDPLYSNLNPMIKDSDSADAVVEFNIEGEQAVTGKITLTTTLHDAPYLPTEDQGPEVTVDVEVLSSDETRKYTGTGDLDGRFIRIFLTKVIEAEEDDTQQAPPAGWIALDCDVTKFDSGSDDSASVASATFSFHRDHYMLFRIDTSGLGLLSPISLGTEADMKDLQERLTSVDPDYLLPVGTTASTAYPGSTMAVHSTKGLPDIFTNVSVQIRRVSDGTPLPANILIPGGKRIYWKVMKDNQAAAIKYLVLSYDSTFRNRDEGLGVYKLNLSGMPTSITISKQIGLDITLSMTVDLEHLASMPLQDQIPEEQYFYPAAGFIRNSNRYLVFAVNTVGPVSAEPAKAWLLYYGTDPDLMRQSQELYLNSRMMEIGNRIIVSPFRAMVFSAYWGADYITQYIPDHKADDDRDRYDTIRSKFIELQAWLEDWFSAYAGKVTDIDFAEVAAGGQEATGLVIKRLDWVLFTQRGYIVRGQLNINLDQTCKIDWTKEVLDVIDAEVNLDSSFVYEEREAAVTDEDLYRPIFSRVAP